MISKRAIILFASGAIIIFAASFFSLETVAFVGYNLIIAALICADYILSPKADKIKIERIAKDTFFFNRENQVELVVTNLSQNDLDIKLMDSFDKNLDKGNEQKELEVNLPADGQKSVKYKVKPDMRGKFLFNSVYIRYTGILGLYLFNDEKKLETKVKVYPDVTPSLNYKIMISKNSLHDSKRKIKVNAIGTQVENLREYIAGDEFRRINWSATARMNKLITNEYDIEKNQNVFIMVDCGRTMGSIYESGALMDIAVSTAAALSDIALYNKDRVGAMSFDTKVKSYIAPINHSSSHAVIDAIYDAGASHESSDFIMAAGYFLKRVNKRSLVIIFTNFNNEAEVQNLQYGIDIISKKHKVMVVMIEDSNLQQIKKSAVATNEDAFKKVSAEHIIKEREELIHTLRKKGVAFVYAPPDSVAYESILSYINLKAKVS